MAATSKTNLRVVIFAGGVGTRMWPLSRKATPKQFEKIIDDQSTLQLAVERVLPIVDPANIFISTGQQYRDTIHQQLPQIPPENIIGEPQMRDVAPAVGYLMSILAAKDPWGPVAILWSDHLLAKVDEFRAALLAGANYIHKHPKGFVFLGQKPRFANQNLGWIQFGQPKDTIDGFEVREFVSWHYRPELKTAQEYFKSEDHSWNPGYFVVAPQYVLDQFSVHAPQMHTQLARLQSAYGSPQFADLINQMYPKFEKISFDDLILAKIAPEEAVVLPVDLGWSDIGTWDALKEALQQSAQGNVIKGKVYSYNSQDSLIYNYTDKLVAAIDCRSQVIVATDDVFMVVPQESIPHIKKMLAEFEGTDLEMHT